MGRPDALVTVNIGAVKVFGVKVIVNRLRFGEVAMRPR